MISISDPAAPVLVGGDSRFARAVAASDPYVYLATGNLQIYCANCPRLSAERVADQLWLKWPAQATDFVLESSPVIPAMQWQAFGTTPQVQDGFYVVNVPLGGSNTFFRLRRP